MRKYDEMSVVRALSKNPDVRITNRGNLKVVEVVKNGQNCGNTTWGKIDFLTKYCGYTQCYIDINAAIEAKQAERAAKKQAAKDAKNARKGIAEGMAKDVKKVMKMRK